MGKRGLTRAPAIAKSRMIIGEKVLMRGGEKSRSEKDIRRKSKKEKEQDVPSAGGTGEKEVGTCSGWSARLKRKGGKSRERAVHQSKGEPLTL